jgi:hypothetical protein
MRFPILALLASVLTAATQPADLVPARWPSDNPASLNILNGSPINCLLVPETNWSNAFLAAAHSKNITVLALVQPGSPPLPRVKRALDLGLDGAVLEGDFPEAEAKAIRNSLSASGKLSVELGLLSMRMPPLSLELSRASGRVSIHMTTARLMPHHPVPPGSIPMLAFCVLSVPLPIVLFGLVLLLPAIPLLIYFAICR